jgi:hypothetical protein
VVNAPSIRSAKTSSMMACAMVGLDLSKLKNGLSGEHGVIPVSDEQLLQSLRGTFRVEPI